MTDGTQGGRRPTRAFAASLTGTALEWYDFAVYSSAAALIFGQLFFPNSDPFVGTLQAFATYAVGYLSRPLGGIVFGRLGDIVGRKRVLIWTLLLIGGATFLVGLLPTYTAIGPTAPLLLVVLRFAQGVGVGGEWGGAVLLSSEYGPANRRGLWASAAQVGPPLGTLAANGVLGFLAAILSTDDFLDWGWRVAFLASALLIAFGLWLRTALEETPVFRGIQQRRDHAKAPITEILQLHRRGLIAAILMRIGPDVLYAMFAVFVLTYATQRLGLTRGQAMTAVMVGSAVQVGAIPFAGWLSDHIGRRLVYLLGAFGGAVSSFVFFLVAQEMSDVMIGVIIALIFHSMMYGPQAAFVAEQFPPRLQYTGSSLGYTLAGILGGAAAPLAFTYLLGTTGSGLAIAIYIAVAACVTCAGLALSVVAGRGSDVR